MDTKGLQQEFISWCKSKKKSPKTEEETKQLFHAFMKEKHPKEYEAAMKQSQQNQTQKAAHGAKLQYIKNLKHQCADDEELYYYKKGGSVNCGCKKKEDGGEVVKAGLGCSSSVVDKFKAVRKGKSGFDITAFADATGSQGGFANAKPKRKTPKKGTWAETTKYIPGQTIQRGNGGPDAKEQDSAVRDRKDNSENIIKKEEKKRHSNYYTSMAFEKGNKIVKKFKAKCGSKMKKK